MGQTPFRIDSSIQADLSITADRGERVSQSQAVC